MFELPTSTPCPWVPVRVPKLLPHVQEQRKKQRREDGGVTPRGSAPPPPADAGAVPACSSRLHTPAAAGRRRLVLVFDLDETLLIFNSLLSGTWAAAHQLQDDPAAMSQLLKLGLRWEAAIMRLCDDRFFFEEVWWAGLG